MTDWKKVFWLVKFDLKHSVKYFFSLALGFIVIYLLIRSTEIKLIEKGVMGIDFLFVFTFSGLLLQMNRPKEFQPQKYRSIRYASPFLTALQQIAIKKEVIVKYRFTVYLLILLVSNGILLIAIYPIFQHLMTLETYTIFAVIWFCFGIYVGCITPAFDVGANLGWNIFYACIFGSLLFFSYIFIFYIWYDNGLIHWTIHIANEFPFLSIMLSLILSFIGAKFWMKIMLKKMNSTDYV